MIEETESYSLTLTSYGLYEVRTQSTVDCFVGIGVAYAWLMSEGLL
jgi:outer membrane protein W